MLNDNKSEVKSADIPMMEGSLLERNFSASATVSSTLDVGPALPFMYLTIPSAQTHLQCWKLALY